MIGIKTFLQSICSFLNRRGILKKCYRCCAILTLGTTIIAVASFCNKEFGGKNNVTATSLKTNGEEKETEEEEESEELSIAAVQLEEAKPESLSETAVQLEKARMREELLKTGQPEQGMRDIVSAAAVKVEEVRPQPEQAEMECRVVETVAQQNAGAVIQITPEEYEILTRIVEAEAGTEDVKGKMLIANVVFNRIAYGEFPDNIKDVVFQKKGKRYQFSPIKDGRYFEVTVQDSTRIAVDRVLAGEDESMGALFFCERAKSSSSNLKWFDSQLKSLFIYGCHEFFVYK